MDPQQPDANQAELVCPSKKCGRKFTDADDFMFHLATCPRNKRRETARMTTSDQYKKRRAALVASLTSSRNGKSKEKSEPGNKATKKFKSSGEEGPAVLPRDEADDQDANESNDVVDE